MIENTLDLQSIVNATLSMPDWVPYVKHHKVGDAASQLYKTLDDLVNAATQNDSDIWYIDQDDKMEFLFRHQPDVFVNETLAKACKAIDVSKLHVDEFAKQMDVCMHEMTKVVLPTIGSIRDKINALNEGDENIDIPALIGQINQVNTVVNDKSKYEDTVSKLRTCITTSVVNFKKALEQQWTELKNMVPEDKLNKAREEWGQHLRETYAMVSDSYDNDTSNEADELDSDEN